MWGECMPDFNIEQKIQEALKRKSFKENKLESYNEQEIIAKIKRKELSKESNRWNEIRNILEVENE